MSFEREPDLYSLAEEVQAARMARAQMERAAEIARMLHDGQHRPELYPALRRAICYALADGERASSTKGPTYEITSSRH